MSNIVKPDSADLQLTPTRLAKAIVSRQHSNNNNCTVTAATLATQLQINNNTMDNGTTAAVAGAGAVTMDAAAVSAADVPADTAPSNSKTMTAGHPSNKDKHFNNPPAANTASGNIKGAADINTCLQNSLDQMQQHFQEMVDLILGKLDDMNRQVEDLEKMLEKVLVESQGQLKINPTA